MLTVFALLYFEFEGNFQVQAPALGLIWRSLFSELYGILSGLSLMESIFQFHYFKVKVTIQ